MRIEASGICHSDVAVLTGDLAVPLPVVLGHEGAGVVVEVGADVTAVRPGDRVVLSAIPTCGRCYFCARGEPNLCAAAPEIWLDGFRSDGEAIRGSSGLGTFADAVVVSERAVVPVRSDLPAEQLSLVGCAVVTGTGSALNLATIEPGDSVLVIGAGGIGLCATQGARLKGAQPLIVIDPVAGQPCAGRTLWRDAHVRPAVGRRRRGHRRADRRRRRRHRPRLRRLDGDVRPGVRRCPGAAARSSRSASRHRRVGIGVPLVHVPLTGKRIIGCVYGGVSVFRDMPAYVALAEAGRLDLDILLGRPHQAARGAGDDWPARSAPGGPSSRQ